MLRYEQYSVALISALPIEILAVELLLDRVHKKDVLIRGGSNLYTLGSICNHNVVVTCLPSGGYGTNSAAKVVTEMRSKFQSIHYGLLIGVAGGAPSPKHDIRLGDVVVSKPERGKGGVFQYDFFKDHPNGTQENIGFLDKPPNVLLSAVNSVCKNHLQGNSQAPPFADYIARICKTRPEFCAPGPAQDILFKPDYHHDPTEDTCSTCIAKGGTNIISRPPRGTSNPIVHYGIIGSGNRVVRDGETRDRIAAPHGILCFEMEAAGVLESFPCLVIRGISDYSDSHKNKAWQPYAALAAAAYAKELLSRTKGAISLIERDEEFLELVSGSSTTPDTWNGHQAMPQRFWWL
ncbi:nucleoside phosphorylase domain-containing protein [Aspergillus lucknowensis]|uniref:Nucleoside phosphorylase domain-containing protein n=1 Tax=Aspergillus lucknowensis TaxID=176173 RepID=A0ABR4LWY0_9EURO